MKLLVVINALESGGAEKLIVTTLPLIKNSDVNVTLLLINAKNSEQTYIKQLEDREIEVIDLNCKSVYDITAIIKIKNQLKKISPDIIHVHLFPAMYWTALAAFLGSKIPLVFTEHSTQNRRLNNICFKYIDKFIYSRYKWIICITESIQEILSQRYKCTNTIVINNGVELIDIEKAQRIERVDLLSQLNIQDQSAKIIFMAARFEFPKRQDMLIRVLKLLPTDCHILFAGVGNNLTRCKVLAAEMRLENQVHFLGFRSDTISIMKSVDINILISDYEGLSGVALESLASGIPFLGSNVSGINNIVPSDDYLFDNNNIEEISGKILWLTRNPDCAQSHGVNGRIFIDKFDMKNMISSHIDLYSKTLNF